MKMTFVNFKIGFFLLLLVLLPQSALNVSKEDNGDCVSSDLSWPSRLSSSRYNKYQLPWSNSGFREPLKIYVTGVVQNVAPIVASESEFRVTVKFVLNWIDSRLSTEDLCNVTNSNVVILSNEVSNLIWLPSPYIFNAKHEEIQQLNRRLISVKLSAGGIVILTMVVNATVDCTMNFQFFPIDVQICGMDLESFLYDNEYVDYSWLESKPFQVVPKRLLQYDVDHVLEYTKSLRFKKQLEKNFTRLTAHFKFTRLWGNHCIQTFIPCTLIVSLSWFSFWLSLDATSARGSLLSTAMLTLVTQFYSLRAVLPPVAYVKAVDVWMFGCMLAIFAAVAEFALVKSLYSITEVMRQENHVQVICTMSLSSGGSTLSNDSHYDRLNKVFYPSYKKMRLGSVVLSGRSTATNDLPSRVEWYVFFGKICIPLIWTTTPKLAQFDEKQCKSQKKLLWKQVDMVSKILFPTSFCIFSVAYWIVLAKFGRCATVEA